MLILQGELTISSDLGWKYFVNLQKFSRSRIIKKVNILFAPCNNIYLEK